VARVHGTLCGPVSVEFLPHALVCTVPRQLPTSPSQSSNGGRTLAACQASAGTGGHDCGCCCGLPCSLHVQDVSGWGVKMECLRVMVQLVASFSKLCAPHLPAALQLSWQMFVGALPAYQSLVVEGEDGDGEQGLGDYWWFGASQGARRW
jgi:hypothetical protein